MESDLQTVLPSLIVLRRSVGLCSLLQVADLVLLLVDASFGFEMEIFEFLNICQVPYSILCSLLLFFRRDLTNKSFNFVMGNSTGVKNYDLGNKTCERLYGFFVCFVLRSYG